MTPAGGADIESYAATDLPSGLAIDAATGVISGTPDTANADVATATVTVSDMAGNTADASIAFPAVDKGDQALTGFQYSSSAVAFGSAAPTVTGPTGVLTSLSYSAAPDTVCTVDATSGALTLVGAGTCAVTASGGRQRRLQRGHRDIHPDGAGRRQPGAQRPDHRRRRY